MHCEYETLSDSHTFHACKRVCGCLPHEKHDRCVPEPKLWETAHVAALRKLMPSVTSRTPLMPTLQFRS